MVSNCDFSRGSRSNVIQLVVVRWNGDRVIVIYGFDNNKKQVENRTEISGKGHRVCHISMYVMYVPCGVEWMNE